MTNEARQAAGDIWVVCCEGESLSGGNALLAFLEGAPRLVQPGSQMGEFGGSVLRSVAALGGAKLEAALLAELEPSTAGAPDPGAIVAMDVNAALVVGHWLKKRSISAPIVGIVGGLALDPAWLETPVDRLVVLDEIQGTEAVDLGFTAEAVAPIGLPICERYAELGAADRRQLRQSLGLAVDTPTCLVVCDEIEEHLSAILFQLSLVNGPIQPLFDVDRDDRAAKLLRERATVYGVKAHLFGHVEEAGQLWAAADFVVGQPRLGVEQRSLTLRQPLLALAPDGARQRARAAAHCRRRWGALAPSTAVLAVELEAVRDGLVADEGRFSIPSGIAATKRIARFIQQVAAEGSQGVKPRVVGSVGGAAEPTGRLETIGSADRPESLRKSRGPVDPDLHPTAAEDLRRSSRLDRSFEEMEIDDALAELKRRMGKGPD